MAGPVGAPVYDERPSEDEHRDIPVVALLFEGGFAAVNVALLTHNYRLDPRPDDAELWMALQGVFALLSLGSMVVTADRAKAPLTGLCAVVLAIALGVGGGFNSARFVYGRSVEIGQNQHVYYESGASKQDAERVGAALRAIGAVKSQKTSAQVKRLDSGRLVVRVIYMDPTSDQELTRYLLQTSLGEPVQLEACDQQFVTKRTFTPPKEK